MDLPTNTLRGKLILDGGSLAGSFFHRSVLLICQHDEEGAFGLILNRPLSPPPATASPFKLPNSLKNHSIFVGGPVQPGALSFLMTDAFIDAEEILPGIALGNHLEDLEARCQHYSPQKSFRLFPAMPAGALVNWMMRYQKGLGSYTLPVKNSFSTILHKAYGETS